MAFWGNFFLKRDRRILTQISFYQQSLLLLPACMFIESEEDNYLTLRLYYLEYIAPAPWQVLFNILQSFFQLHLNYSSIYNSVYIQCSYQDHIYSIIKVYYWTQWPKSINFYTKPIYIYCYIKCKGILQGVLKIVLCFCDYVIFYAMRNSLLLVHCYYDFCDFSLHLMVSFIRNMQCKYW